MVGCILVKIFYVLVLDTKIMELNIFKIKNYQGFSSYN